MSQKKKSDIKWRKDSWVFMRKVKAVIDQLEPHWPLTLRQIYYQCVAAQILKNTKAQYEKLSRKRLVRQAILRRLDVDVLAEEQARETQEKFALAVLKRQGERIALSA